MAQNDGDLLGLDVGRIEAVAAGYPEQMREPVIWLANYVRTNCARKVSLLATRVNQLGYTTTDSTLSKILRGRWNTDSEGKPVRPVMKLESFLRLVEQLQSQARVEELSGAVPFIQTPTWHEINNYIDTRRAPQRICRVGFIAGPTGAQKSECFKEKARQLGSAICAHVEAPESTSTGEFVRELAAAYGLPTGRKSSLSTIKLRIADVVNATRTIIIDNFQRLFRVGDGWNQPALSYLQKLQDDKRCTLILSATLDFNTKLSRGLAEGYFEQFEGRVGGRNEFLVLPEYAPSDDVLCIAQAFQIPDPERHLEYLESLARKPGRIRILFNALQKATQLAGVRKEPITINHVRMAMDDDAINLNHVEPASRRSPQEAQVAA